MFDVVSKLMMQIHKILVSTKRWSKFFIYFEIKFPQEKITKNLQNFDKNLTFTCVRIITLIFY